MANSRPPGRGSSRVPKPKAYRIVADASGLVARRGVRDLARQLGFGVKACEELVIVVAELSSNILKYGISGSIEMCRVDDLQHGIGIQIVAEDGTPPFDLAMALRDGFDAKGQLDPTKMFRRGGIGAGIGAVHRFSHILLMEPSPPGKRIRVIRFLRPPVR